MADGPDDTTAGGTATATPPAPTNQNVAARDQWLATVSGGAVPKVSLPSSGTQTPAAAASLPQQQQPAPQPATAPVVTSTKRGGLLGVMDSMADVLVGKQRPELGTDADGNAYVKQHTMTRGEQWMRIAGEGMRGAAAGLAAGRGAGNMGKAAQAGIQAQEQASDREQAQVRGQVQDKRQQILDQANNQMLRMKIAEETWRATRAKVEATQGDIAFWQGQQDRIEKHDGIFLGTTAHPGDIADIRSAHPDVMKDLVKNPASLAFIPQVDENGVTKGFAVYKTDAAKYGNELEPTGTKFPTFNNVTGEYEWHSTTTPTKQSEIDQYWNSAGTAALKFRNDKAEAAQKEEATKNLESERLTREAEKQGKLDLVQQQIKEARANTAKSWAEERKTKLEADAAVNTGDDIESQAQALVDRRSAPSLMTKRSKDYNAIMKRANELSMAQKGEPYNQEAGEIGYQSNKKVIESFAGGEESKNLESYDKFLGHALAASESINSVRNQNVKLINTPLNVLATMMGTERSNEVVAMLSRTAVLRSEYESMLKNNTALTDQDKKEGQRILDDNATPAQMQSAMRAMVHTAAVRMSASDYTFARTTGNHVPNLLSPEENRSLQHFGVDPLSVYTESVGIKMKAPDGTVTTVPRQQVKHFQDLGAQVVE